MDIMKSQKNSFGRIEIKMEDIKNSVRFFPIKQDRTKLIFAFDNDNKTYYFKANSRFSYDQNEVLASLLLSQNGVKTNEPEFCSFIANGKKYNGIISKDIVENRKNTEIINYEHIFDIYNGIDLCVDYIEGRVQLYCQNHNIKADPNLYDDLSIRSLVFYITGQQDFNHRNIEFEIKKDEAGEKVLSLMPIIDKSITFFATIDDKDDNNAFNKITFKQVKEYPKACTHALIYGFMFDTNEFELNEHRRNITELAMNILKNKKLETVFRSFANYDFKKAIKEYTLNNPNFKFNPETIQKAILFFENNREDLVNMVKLLDNNFFSSNNKITDTGRQFE